MPVSSWILHRCYDLFARLTLFLPAPTVLQSLRSSLLNTSHHSFDKAWQACLSCQNCIYLACMSILFFAFKGTVLLTKCKDELFDPKPNRNNFFSSMTKKFRPRIRGDNPRNVFEFEYHYKFEFIFEKKNIGV